jgi:hypothetical protein
MGAVPNSSAPFLWPVFGIPQVVGELRPPTLAQQVWGAELRQGRGERGPEPSIRFFFVARTLAEPKTNKIMYTERTHPAIFCKRKFTKQKMKTSPGNNVHDISVRGLHRLPLQK